MPAHRVRISVRAGSYVPQFSLIEAAERPIAEEYTRGVHLLGLRTPRELAQAHDCFWQLMVEERDSPEGYLGLAQYYAVAIAVEYVSPRDGLPLLRMALAQHDRCKGDSSDNSHLS